MKQCKCGSFAINEDQHGREKGKYPELCDVCYWRKMYDDLKVDRYRLSVKSMINKKKPRDPIYDETFYNGVKYLDSL